MWIADRNLLLALFFSILTLLLALLSTDKSRKDFKPNFADFYYHFNSLFRPKDLPFKVNETIELSDMSAEVISVDADGQPTTVRFDFDASLDNPNLCWLQWHWKKSGLGYYSKFIIPPVGETSRTQGPFDDM